MARKFRILAVGDLHGDAKTSKKLARQAKKENVDLVILAGDITGWTETENIIKPFKDEKKQVLLIPGNWDSIGSIEFLANIYGMKNIHGYSIRHGKIGIFGAGGAEGPGPGAISERELMKTLEKAYNGIRGIEKKIMVTHMHPSGSKSEFSGVAGSKAITEAIKKFKPDILLHSHIHEGGGIEEMIGDTIVVNVGMKGKIIEI